MRATQLELFVLVAHMCGLLAFWKVWLDLLCNHWAMEDQLATWAQNAHRFIASWICCVLSRNAHSFYASSVTQNKNRKDICLGFTTTRYKHQVNTFCARFVHHQQIQFLAKYHKKLHWSRINKTSQQSECWAWTSSKFSLKGKQWKKCSNDGWRRACTRSDTAVPRRVQFASRLRMYRSKWWCLQATHVALLAFTELSIRSLKSCAHLTTVEQLEALVIAHNLVSEWITGYLQYSIWERY